MVHKDELEGFEGGVSTISTIKGKFYLSTIHDLMQVGDVNTSRYYLNTKVPKEDKDSIRKYCLIQFGILL